ncbi:3D-(3,5/4)-trihydroxycyclohexane-1,2-dione acylhydrolase (decyclizing) [Virgibacillus salarius]|uniref:3D-(3,5/4)-trihydroxycyclohexane-1,2-dione acylhydrolase (decyclizing) n=1 Tax=Virgibacillus salarius TaxID=447199 RepID=UPI0031DB3B6A
MSKRIRLTTAQALVKFLNQQFISIDGIETPFVEGIFHIYGHGNVLGLGEALENNPGHLKSYQGKNEQGMAHAAIAFSKQHFRQKIFGVSASAGPGSANMLTAAGTAFANNIPVLFLPADTFATRQPDPVLQQLEHEHSTDITTNEAFKAVSKYWDRIDRPEQLMSALLRAFEVLTNPATTGPVTICLPQDIEAMAYDYPTSFFNKRVHYVDRKLPTQRELDGAISSITQSKRPVLLVGGGAKYSQARDELVELSEKANIPIVETHAGKSTVAFTHNNNLGGNGILGTSAANKAVMNADLIIGIGTRYSDFTTSSKTLFDFDNTTFLNINVNRGQAYKFDGFQVVADAKATLQLINKHIGDYQSSYAEEMNALRLEWEKERNRLAGIEFNRDNFTPEISEHFSQEILNAYADALKTELTQTAALIKINDIVDDDAIVVSSAGSLPGDMQRLWNANVTNTFHLEYGYSCMGYEIAGALGAKLANPDKESYAVVGDGSFLMLHSEIVTALQYDKKINLLLFNNSGFGCINNLQMDHGNGSTGTEFRNLHNEIMNIDYSKIGEGYGLKTYSVNNLEDLTTAMEDAKRQSVSTLIEIKVLPKTMTDGYDGSWWNVGVAEVSERESVQRAYAKTQQVRDNARQY